MEYTGDWTLMHVVIPAEYYYYRRSKDKKAYLFVIPATDNSPQRDVWLPKSQCKEWKQKDKKISFDCPHKIVKENLIECFIDTSGEPSLFEPVESDLMAESERRAEDFHYQDNRQKLRDEHFAGTGVEVKESLSDILRRSRLNK